EMLDKVGVAKGFVDHVVGVLVDRASPADAAVEVRVGPVSADAARVWVANTKAIIEAVAAHPEELAEPIPPDVIDLFRSFLDQWEGVAASTSVFRWVARANPADVGRVV